MKATRFMRQPFFVTGYQVDEENMEAIAKWCEGHVIKNDSRAFVRVPVNNAKNVRQTEAYVGCWVLKSTFGKTATFKVYPAEWIGQSFIRIPDDPDDNVEMIEKSSNHNEGDQTLNNLHQLQIPTAGSDAPTSLRTVAS